MTQLNRIRFRYVLSFGHSQSVEQPNGMYKSEFVKDFSRHAALYTVTDRTLQVLTGVDTTKDIVFAVTRQYHDQLTPFLDTSDLQVQLSSDPKSHYSVTQVSYADDSELQGVHLIAIRKVESN